MNFKGSYLIPEEIGATITRKGMTILLVPGPKEVEGKARFKSSTFTNAKIQCVDFRMATFEDVNFEDAALIDEYTLFPDGFTLPKQSENLRLDE